MGPNAIRWASKRSDGPRGPPSRQTGLEAIRRASRASEGLRGPTRVCKSDPECECRREGREGPRGQPRGRGWAFHAAGPCGCESELEAALNILSRATRSARTRVGARTHAHTRTRTRTHVGSDPRRGSDPACREWAARGREASRGAEDGCPGPSGRAAARASLRRLSRHCPETAKAPGPWGPGAAAWVLRMRGSCPRPRIPLRRAGPAGLRARPRTG